MCCAQALILASIGAGVLQILSGVTGVGSLLKSTLPLPVLWAFPTGVGAALLISQLSRAVELPGAWECGKRMWELMDTHTFASGKL